MPGYESRSIPALRYFIDHGEWPRLEVSEETGKHAPVGGGGKPPILGLKEGKGGTGNHQWQWLRVGSMAGLIDRLDVLRAYQRERRYGHMGNEFGSPSHCDEHYAAHAAGVIWDRRHAPRLYQSSLDWWATELAWCKRCEAAVKRPSGRVVRTAAMTGPRAWSYTRQPWRNGGDGAPDQHSSIRDEGVLGWGWYGERPRGAYVGPDADVMALLTHPEMPWDEIRGRALLVDVAKTKVISPVFEVDGNAGAVVRYWHPPESLNKGGPVVHEVSIYPRENRVTYSCEPSRFDARGAARQLGV